MRRLRHNGLEAVVGLAENMDGACAFSCPHVSLPAALGNASNNFKDHNKMTATMNRRHYTKPAMRVVELQQRGLLMTSGMRNGYGTANDGVDESELDGNGMWNWD